MNTGTTILIVEDDQELRTMLQSMFTKQFSTVLTAVNGKMGEEMLQEHTPDLVLSDLHMPEMGGIDMVKSLRAKGNDVPIVIMSSSTDRAELLKVLKLGVLDYVEKPFKRKDLEKAILRTLQVAMRTHGLQDLVAIHGPESEEVKKMKKLIGLFRIMNAENV